MTFWEKIKALFLSVEQSSKTEPVEHHLIQRSETELKAYDHWKNTVSAKRLMNWLNEQYVQFLVNPEHVDEAMDFLRTPSSNGFVIHFYKTQYPKAEVTHFFDFLKEKVLTLDYRTYVSDSRTYSKNKKVENLQRHYLKPPSPFRKLSPTTEEPLNQSYGNITIELLSRNDQIHQLKFSATGYRDRLYKEAQGFDELMKHLLH